MTYPLIVNMVVMFVSELRKLETNSLYHVNSWSLQNLMATESLFSSATKPPEQDLLLNLRSMDTPIWWAYQCWTHDGHRYVSNMIGHALDMCLIIIIFFWDTGTASAPFLACYSRVSLSMHGPNVRAISFGEAHWRHRCSSAQCPEPTCVQCKPPSLALRSSATSRLTRKAFFLTFYCWTHPSSSPANDITFLSLDPPFFLTGERHRKARCWPRPILHSLPIFNFSRFRSSFSCVARYNADSNHGGMHGGMLPPKPWWDARWCAPPQTMMGCMVVCFPSMLRNLAGLYFVF